MNKILFQIIGCTLIMLFVCINFAFGKTISEDHLLDYYFPLPAGNITLNRGLIEGVHYGYDFHAYQTHKNSDTPGGVNGSCLDYGVPILSAGKGHVRTINQTGWGGGFGTYVLVINNEFSYYYGHMIENSIQVKVGDEVDAGQLLGLMGSTGISEGRKCTLNKENPLTGKKEDVQVNGIHLHFEIRNGSTSYHVHSFLGKKIYLKEDMIRGGKYISTTKMQDADGYWAKYGYRYDYVLPPEAIGDMPTPKITSITPLIVKKGEKTTFTIKGKLLPEDMNVSIPGCNDKKWILNTNGRRGHNKQQFTCTNYKVDDNSGFISISKAGKDGKDIEMGITIKVIREGEVVGDQYVNNDDEVVDKNIIDNIKAGQESEFTITGNNLPGDLMLSMPICEEITFLSRGPELQRVKCKVSKHIYNKDGKRYNKEVSHPIQIKNQSGELLFNSSVLLNHKVRITNVKINNNFYGKNSQFTFMGEGLNLVDAYHVDACAELTKISQSENELILECMPLIKEKLFSPILPNYLKKDIHGYVLKDRPGGNILFKGELTIRVQDPTSWIEKVSPINPELNKHTTFYVKGSNMPNGMLYWIDNCGSGELEVISSEFAQFSCMPAISGDGNLLKIKEAAINTKDDPKTFIDAIDTQRRMIEIKYPKKYSRINRHNGESIVIYRSEILPILKDYNSLYFQAINSVGKKNKKLFGAKDENEEIIQYILTHNKNYSNSFLEKFNWKVYSDGNYELKECSDELDKMGNTFTISSPYTYRAALNTAGSCAKGLDNFFLKEAEDRLYPKKEEVKEIEIQNIFLQ